MIMCKLMVAAMAVLSLSLSGCAEYIQDAEAIAQKGITNQQRIDDDFIKGVSIAPQAVPAGALARYPAGPQKCAIATLAGLELSGCTAATTQDVQSIVQQQMSVHFGPTVPAAPPAALSSSPASTASPVTSSKPVAQSKVNPLAAKVAALMAQH